MEVVIRSSHRGIPRDRSEAYDMAVKTLTDCLTSALSGMRVHTRLQPNPHTHTHMHTKSQWHIILPMQFWLTSILMGILQASYFKRHNNAALQDILWHYYNQKKFFLLFFSCKIWFVLVVPVCNTLKCFHNMKIIVKLYNGFHWLFKSFTNHIFY